MQSVDVDTSSPLIMSANRSDSPYHEEKIDTEYGSILVAHQGADHKLPKPVIITYHDIGLNHVSNFQTFFEYMDMKLLLQSFAIFHINAPGQDENAPQLPENYVYPSMDQLAEQISSVCKFYGIKNFTAFGVGAGANILCRFALTHPDYVDGLFLVNPTSTSSTWTEWLYHKFNSYYLGLTKTEDAISSPFPQPVQDYLMWHHFGKSNTERNKSLMDSSRSYFSGKSLNAHNLSLFIDSYNKRTDLGLVRLDKKRNFNCSVLVLCGDFSSHVEDTVTFNARLNPSNSTWMKLQDCGMPIKEQPGKVSEAFRLFLQGLGYALTVYERRRSSLRKMSSTSSSETEILMPMDSYRENRQDSIDEDHEHINMATMPHEGHIVRNPIAQH